MTAAEKEYIKIMKKKTGEERLQIAFELRKLALELAKASIESRNPKISSQELKKKVQQRIYGSSFPF